MPGIERLGRGVRAGRVDCGARTGTDGGNGSRGLRLGKSAGLYDSYCGSRWLTGRGKCPAVCWAAVPGLLRCSLGLRGSATEPRPPLGAGRVLRPGSEPELNLLGRTELVRVLGYDQARVSRHWCWAVGSAPGRCPRLFTALGHRPVPALYWQSLPEPRDRPEQAPSPGTHRAGAASVRLVPAGPGSQRFSAPAALSLSLRGEPLRGRGCHGTAARGVCVCGRRQVGGRAPWPVSPTCRSIPPPALSAGRAEANSLRSRIRAQLRGCALGSSP